MSKSAEVSNTTDTSKVSLTEGSNSTPTGESQNIQAAYRFILKSVKQTYSKVRDTAQIYEIKTKISSTKQGSQSITEYSNLLQSLWQEMDHYQCIQMKCIEDAPFLKRFVEKDQIYDFLAELNIEFDVVRVQILRKEDLPQLNETIEIVRAEEGRRGVMIETNPMNGSALVSKATNVRNVGLGQPSSENKR